MAIFLMFCFLAAPAYGAVKGQVYGLVTDSVNDVKLSGVQVATEDGKNKAVTNKNGEYRITLPEGDYVLTFSYIGYDQVTKTARVTAGETLNINVDFGDAAFMLEEVVVVGQTVGQLKALNRQKTAPNLENIVASDAFGRFPDQNAAEALDRLPGVSVARDQGEGRFVIVRGINPDLSTASVDGVSLAAPDADARSVLLDVLPMNVMETLVVTKALTPDMPGDAIGGHVDIEMPSAFDKSERTISGSVGGNYSDLTGDWGESIQATYGDTFGADDQFGFLISASHDKRELGSDNMEADTWEMNDDGEWETEEVEYREYDLTRERMGVTTNLEFRPTDNDKYYIRGLYGEYEDHEYRRLTNLGDMGLSASSLTTEAETTLELKDRTETQKNMTVSAGGENVMNTWTLDYMAAYSYGEQDTPDDTEFKYEYDGTLEYTFEGLGGDTPFSVTDVSGGSSDLGSYEFDEVEDADQIVEEKAWLFSADVKKELGTQLPTYLKGGLYASLKNKTSDIEVYTNGETPEAYETLEGNTSGGRNEFSDFPLIDKNLADRFKSDIDEFDMEWEEVDSLAEDYETDEKVYAGYLMANVDFGKVNLMAGARVEYTDLEATGYNIYEGEDETVINLETKTNDYTNVLPGVHVRTEISENLIFYGAWTNTISRPNWEQTRYARVTEEDDGDIETEVGNPELDPYEAMNWDATLSYYMSSVGMASVGFFYKDIDNFIYSQTHELHNDVDDYDYEETTWNNGEGGTIWGVELAYQQQFTSLPAPLDGFSIQGNLTLSGSEADVPATDDLEARTVDFVGHSDTVGSVALSFEKWDFFIRLSGTYQSEYLDSLGGEAYEDEYIDEHFQMDLSTSYTIMEKYTLYANFININNEPLKAYWGESKMLKQYEEYGMSVRAGVKFNF